MSRVLKCDYCEEYYCFECAEPNVVTPTTACFDRLETPEAKAYLRQRWMEWKGLTA